MKKILLIIFTFLTGITYSQQPTSQQIENLYSFSKLYGYIRYFHPSDEADKINWSNFAVYGAEKIENCKNKEELKEELLKLFKPLAPSLKIIYKDENYIFDIKEITPTNPEEYEIYYWRHNGLAKETSYSMIFASWRNGKDFFQRHKTNIVKYGLGMYPLHDQYAKRELKIGELINKDIGNNLVCIFPLVIYGNENDGTYPKVKLSEYKSLNDSVNTRFDLIERGKNKYNRLAGIIITWNTIQHFYPYLEDLQIDWEKDLQKYLTKTYRDENDLDYINTLKLFTAQLKDGHMFWSWPRNASKRLPIAIDYAEDKFFISKIMDSLSVFEKGDIITEIDGLPINEYYESKKKYVQASSETSRQIRALNEINSCEKQEKKIKIERINEEINIKLERSWFRYDLYNYDKLTLGDSIKIIKLQIANDNDLNILLSDTSKIKHMIFDFREYPNTKIQNALGLLMGCTDTTKWLGKLVVLEPDRVGKREICWEGWTHIVPKESKNKIKKYFLINGKTISQGESIIALLQHYKVGKIIGERTAGINGDVNRLELPGGFSTTWTGLYVRKPDGTKHFCEGIVPDIEVKRTIKGIVEGRDEILERAIEYIKNGK